MDRAEATGLGAAVAGHAGLMAALTLGFANAAQPPLMSPPIEVSFVDEVGLQSAVTQVAPEPPAQSVAPEAGPPEEAAPLPAEAPAPPEPAPKAAEALPEPKPVPKQAAKPAPARPAPVKAQPAKPQAPAAGKAKATTGSRLGDNFLKGLGSDPSPSRSTRPSGAVMSAQALSSIAAAIQRQIQPCANRQVNPGPGANEITVRLNLRLNRDGSLAGRPRVAGTVGVDAENRRYEERVKDLAIAAFSGCSPLRGLPEDLYDVPGGWSNFIFRYKLP
jgi:outer membrane biosynthesis protein TonB